MARHLAVTDDLGELPGEGSLATDRALVGARLAMLPTAADPTGPAEVEPLSAAERTDLVRGSSPRRRPPASGWTPSTARSWPRCTSA